MGVFIIQLEIVFEKLVDFHLHHVVDLGGPVVEAIVDVKQEDLLVAEMGRNRAKTILEFDRCPGMSGCVNLRVIIY